MKVLAVLALAVFTACNANVLWQDPPKQQLDIFRDAFWDYVAKATLTAEGTLQKIRESEVAREVNTRITESTDAVNQYTVAMRSQVTPLTHDLLAKLSQEAELLKARFERDLSATTAELQPYSDELKADLARQVEEMKRDITTYVETFDSEPASLLQKSEELKETMDQSVQQIQAQLGPYTEEVKQKVLQNLKEFQKTIIPLTQTFQTQLNQRTQEIKQNLSPYGEELKNLDPLAEDLKSQLAALWHSFTEKKQ
ncbi:hypothetical protein DPEC_G00203520 [Dallia pectoralis]|uniref:Uncharacterized protein n=1 Tax=Dallia pectoralis TaxID=75939 RepID=A0ACC2G9Q6_DALPE|nr:hypothetical protein DPEC_G00203520 [Dallia pectoralis]